MASFATPSAALVRTARSELERIDRGTATIEQRRAALLGQLAELDEEAESLTRRRLLLEELVSAEQAAPSGRARSARAPSRRSLKGAELRRVAGKLLWSTQRDSEIHYREWFERVIAESYAIGGKDPAASFLTNIRDSPAVRRGSMPGHYRLDPSSIELIGQQISEAHAELADLERSIERVYADTESGRSAEPLREHRERLQQSLKRLESSMNELRYIFAEDTSEPEITVRAVQPLQAA
jgi:hypothetical protein